MLRRSAAGTPIKRIAADLDIEAGTASTYLESARRKTGIESRAELVRWFGEAVRLGEEARMR